MNKRFLIAATGLVGLTLVFGATRRITAAETVIYPSDSVQCYYHLYNCVYPNDNWWSNCDPRYGQGMLPTSVARAICTKYNVWDGD